MCQIKCRLLHVSYSFRCSWACTMNYSRWCFSLPCTFYGGKRFGPCEILSHVILCKWGTCSCVLRLQAALGNQRRQSRMARLKNKKFSWNQGLPFAATLPVKPKNFKIILCEMDRAYGETCPVALAFIPILKLLKEKSGMATYHLPKHSGTTGMACR